MADIQVPFVVEQFKQFAAAPDANEVVATIQALTEVLRKSRATTTMGVQADLDTASSELIKGKESSISIKSGCELFKRFITRMFRDAQDFEECKAKLIHRGERFKKSTVISRLKIVNHAKPFITDDCTILVHGYSRVVLAVLHNAVSNNKRFKVVVTESRPDEAGIRMVKALDDMGVPTVFISDSAVAHYLANEVDVVFVGAEAVVENGGIVNKIGTYQISIIANTFNKPFYVAAESYKFTRIYPLNQKDIPYMGTKSLVEVNSLPSSTEVWNAGSDFTPPKFIRLLFTDLGVLTPSAVSDELIKLYN